VLTLNAERRFAGAGTALIDAVPSTARDAGCARVWLITNDENVDAMRFNPAPPLRLAALHAGAANDSRARPKPGSGAPATIGSSCAMSGR
jgi:hypothetical protein